MIKETKIIAEKIESVNIWVQYCIDIKEKRVRREPGITTKEIENMKTTKLNMEASTIELVKIHEIVSRALGLMGAQKAISPLNLHMDVTACHLNGTPLDLDGLLNAKDSDLTHDVMGIHFAMDRKTGQLQNCFAPRYSALQIAMLTPAELNKELEGIFTKSEQCPLNGDTSNDCAGCVYAGDFQYNKDKKDCERRPDFADEIRTDLQDALR